MSTARGLRAVGGVGVALTLALALTPRLAAGQCALEGRARFTLAGGTSVEQSARVTLAGVEAVIEGLAPLVFRVTVPVGDVALYVGDEGASGAVLAATRGVRVRVASARGDAVVGELSDGDELSVRGVSLPCRALATAYAQPAGAAMAPPHDPDVAYTSRALPPLRVLCSERRGAQGVSRGCASLTVPPPGNDPAQGGYHPRGRALRVYATPATDAPSVELVATRDVVLVDEDQRPGWLRVRTTRHASQSLHVAGWVREPDVAWAREVPPWVRRGEVPTVARRGRARHADERLGFVAVAAETDVTDERGVVFGRVAAGAWCTAAAQRRGEARVTVALPGSDFANGEPPVVGVPGERATWVDACP